MRGIPAAALTVCVVLLAESPASTWGRDGHRIVARIAAKNLTSAARAKVAAILKTSSSGVESAMADAATWPDEIDKSATRTFDWHFINARVDIPFDVAGLCPHHGCVVDRIEEMRTRLKQNETGFSLAAAPIPPRPMTSQELAFLIHFVGDVHQPLHAANDGDRGGNCVALATPIVHPDQTTTTELHGLWDVDEVLAVVARHGGDDQKTAAALFQQYKRGTKVAQGTVAQWARESNALARHDVYEKLSLPMHTAPAGQCAAGIAPVAVGDAYLAGTADAAEQQLLRAGIRLSNVLNAICRGAGCVANP